MHAGHVARRAGCLADGSEQEIDRSVLASNPAACAGGPVARAYVVMKGQEDDGEVGMAASAPAHVSTPSQPDI